MKDLLAEIARTVVNKQSPLTGFELRFLRKRLSKKGTEFAQMVSLTPQSLSRLESSDEAIDAGRDKLIRVIYRALSGDRKLKNVLSIEKKFEQWLTSIQGKGTGEHIIASRLKNNHWRVEAAPTPAAALA